MIFNIPDNEWDKKTLDYLLLGNSFVQGACVDRPKDISSQLRKISNIHEKRKKLYNEWDKLSYQYNQYITSQLKGTNPLFNQICQR